LRQALLAQRAAAASPKSSLTPGAAGEAVAAQLDGIVRFGKGLCVAVYAPVRGELDPGPIAAVVTLLGGTVCYPRVIFEPQPAGAGLQNGGADEKKRQPALAFHPVSALSELQAGEYGIPAPPATLPLAPRLDIFIVPGLGFDGRGRRLGFGRGYYDAALHAQPAALRVGIGYDWQLVPAVPFEPHDEMLDVVVTPGRCLMTFARAVHSLCRLPHTKEEQT